MISSYSSQSTYDILILFLSWVNTNLAASSNTTFVVTSTVGIVIALGYTVRAILEITRTQARLID